MTHEKKRGQMLLRYGNYCVHIFIALYPVIRSYDFLNKANLGTIKKFTLISLFSSFFIISFNLCCILVEATNSRTKTNVDRDTVQKSKNIRTQLII